MKTSAENRSGHKRLAVMEAALRLFLDKGYDGTSMDDVAAEAGVSKPTVYRYFADKEQLFAEIVGATTNQIGELVSLVTDTLADSTDLEKDLTKLARRLLAGLLRPEFVRLRRLVIANAERFPAVSRSWFESGFERVLATLAECFMQLNSRKRLRVDDPYIAANHFAGLLLWIPVNRAMFTGGPVGSEAELNRLASEAVSVFVAAYGVHQRS